ncbi:hypothetical protein [Amycolatopsis regifaucium]|uniref:Uncharacterized protein n=1 Tax=Amycolatopsis regifaucium TaxID=546365 RepID=A0A154MG52_9PSEU|nr:hypothetical protein [Amycolatopsis regifaucium]KZB83415.1 hypothetical protein AVL48_04555 [Amycolatopsis regifaucium]OKA08879.1 hypothetical protein ATP06_0211020 [Amycolatopsis regifaucium]SFI90664.1 hypothetical protein SAMN04489731_11411 [Amycolatopsis regifaucium]
MAGNRYGIVNYEIGYADGRRDKLHMIDQFVPFTELRERRKLVRITVLHLTRVLRESWAFLPSWCT